MEIFKKKKVRCNDVYVLTTEIVSNYDDGAGWGVLLRNKEKGRIL